MRVNTGAGYPASVITAISIGGESMASVLKTIASSVVAASVAVSAFSVSYAATLLEPVKINPVTISDLNKTFETDTHVDLQGIDAISIIPYTKSGNFPYVIQYDMTINTPLFAGSTDKNIEMHLVSVLQKATRVQKADISRYRLLQIQQQQLYGKHQVHQHWEL